MSIENTNDNYFQNITPEEKHDEIIDFLGEIAYGELDGNLPLNIRYLPIEDAYIMAKNRQHIIDIIIEEREYIIEEIINNYNDNNDDNNRQQRQQRRQRYYFDPCNIIGRLNKFKHLL